ncbi:MAG: helix-turn-helix domain-containing protein [Candidatus Daviesbacteria bacterium]|nr:MAG: helix-turn-helix domain-containing protein [Candidatus Daviesbacteria bacterium]
MTKMAEEKVKLPELLTIKQVAKILNVHPTTLRRWDKKGKLKAIRVGTRRGVGERRYHREDIIKLIEK